jgi:hypothetical protein
MIAFDPVEEMRAQRFELISTYAIENGGSGRVEIKLDEIRIEIPHRKMRYRCFVGAHLAAAHEAESGMKTMGAARELGELGSRFGPVRGLAEKPSAAFEDLVGGQDEIVRVRTVDRLRLGAGKMAGDFVRRRSAPAQRNLALSLVEVGRNHDEFYAGRGKQLPA